MATRGRKPKPQSLKILSGTDRKRAMPSPEVATAFAVAAGVPPKPDMVANDPIASEEWDRVARILHERGTLTTGDLGIMCAYTCMFSILCRAGAASADHIEVESYGGKSRKLNPAIKLASEAGRTLVSIAAELGLTPASRARVQGVAPANRDEFQAFLDGGGEAAGAGGA